MQEIEERISHVEDRTEEIDILLSKKIPVKTNKQTPGTKHTQNLGYYKKPKSKNNRNRQRIKNTGQWPRKYIQYNHRRKFP